MCRAQSIGAVLTAIALAVPGPVPAASPGMMLPNSPSERLELFETCAGRLSALIEHQWLIDPPASDRTEALRDQFDDLIGAVLPDALDWGMPQAMAMQWRISAKAAQADLLTTSVFGTDRMRAARAAEVAGRRIAACGGLLTS